MQVRDRIKELRRVTAKDLIPNPRNWRTHPKAQADALRGILAEVGIADALIARELPDGRLMLIDGHLRAETLPEEVVPVLVLDVSEVEAEKIMLTLDPLAGMAEADEGNLRALLDSVHTESDAITKMLEGLAVSAGLIDQLDEKHDVQEAQDAPEMVTLSCTPDQADTIYDAMAKMKELAEDKSDMSDGRILELICADWLSGR